MSFMNKIISKKIDKSTLNYYNTMVNASTNQNQKYSSYILNQLMTLSYGLIMYFLFQIDQCVTDEEIDNLFEQDEKKDTYIAIVDASGWPTTEAVNSKSKSTLVQQLVIDELINKRKTSLDELRKGLKLSGVFGLMQDHPKLFSQAFIHIEQKLTPVYIKELLASFRPEDYPQCQAYDWFIDFLDSNGKKVISLHL